MSLALIINEFLFLITLVETIRYLFKMIKFAIVTQSIFFYWYIFCSIKTIDFIWFENYDWFNFCFCYCCCLLASKKKPVSIDLNDKKIYLEYLRLFWNQTLRSTNLISLPFHWWLRILIKQKIKRTFIFE